MAKVPEKLSLARLCTPLERLERLEARLELTEHGVQLWCKRDDLTGLALSGNKIRKLEYLLAEAQAMGATTIITGGGEQSNHARATAVAAARIGLKSHLCLRVSNKDEPPPLRGNTLLDTLVGASIEWIDHSDWARRTELFEERADELRAKGEVPYVIPEGGSNALGCWGYVDAIEELRGDLSALEEKDTTLIYACGSGGTGAGLELGKDLYKASSSQIASLRLLGVPVCDDARYFRGCIEKMVLEFSRCFEHHSTIDIEKVEMLEGYVGRGYAKSGPEEWSSIRLLAETEGIFVDPCYTGKAFHGMVSELKTNPRVFGERVVLLHTGGLFGLFGQGPETLPL